MNILVVYYARDYPLRTSVADHLFSFARYSGGHCYYLNLASPGLPRSLSIFEPDLIVFHTILLSQRIVPELWEAIVDKMAFLAGSNAVKAIFPQDEYVHADALCRFVNDFGVQHVFSCAQPDQWPVIYREVDREKAHFHTVLTGYLSDHTVRRIERLARRSGERDIDIGYRAWYPWPCLGRHAQLKGLLGDAFKAKSTERGMVSDISNDLNDTFLGDDWYRFLLRCRYTPGVEGGASILDYDGEIMRCTAEYLAGDAAKTYEDVEAACFPGAEGSLRYFALSPRHLEACATRTCQLLVEGDYDGVLLPNVHYIPLKRDLGNIDEVLDTVVRDDDRSRMVERAFDDVVRSREWTYESFLRLVLGAVGTVSKGRRASGVVFRGRCWDRLWWFRRAVKYRTRRLMVVVLGEEGVLALMRRLRRLLGR